LAREHRLKINFAGNGGLCTTFNRLPYVTVNLRPVKRDKNSFLQSGFVDDAPLEGNGIRLSYVAIRLRNYRGTIIGGVAKVSFFFFFVGRHLDSGFMDFRTYERPGLCFWFRPIMK